MYILKQLLYLIFTSPVGREFPPPPTCLRKDCKPILGFFDIAPVTIVIAYSFSFLQNLASPNFTLQFNHVQ